MAFSMDKYDPNAVIEAANDKLSTAGGDIEGASLIFQSALLEWSDDAREGVSDVHQFDLETLKEAIATLWIAYAQFYANHKQFKSATEAYEQAVTDPVAKHVGRVWLEYARFLEERNKLKSAQDVYIRVLVKDAESVDEQDQALLWSEFLEMMQKSNPTLTLRDLQTAVEQEHARPDRATSHETMEEEDNDARPNKRPRFDSATSASSTNQDNKTYVVTPESVAQESRAFGDVLEQQALPPDVAAGWMIRDGSGPAQRPEPSLFRPSPPKLADPTAKDILGAVLALKLMERLVGASGSVLLNVCQGLWALQALKEKEAKAAIDMLDETMTREHEQLETTLDARLAVAGGAASAVQQLNATERQAFHSTCMQQRQNLMCGIAWEFRQLLCLQQQVLTKLDLPGFEGPTVDSPTIDQQAKICSYLHSAFFLRNRIGQAPHVGMLQKQMDRLKVEIEQGGGHGMSPVMQGHQGPMSPSAQGAVFNGYHSNIAPVGQIPPQQMPFHQMPPMQQPSMMYGGYPQQQQQQQQLLYQQQQQQPMHFQQQQGQYGGVSQQQYYQP